MEKMKHITTFQLFEAESGQSFDLARFMISLNRMNKMLDTGDIDGFINVYRSQVEDQVKTEEYISKLDVIQPMLIKIDEKLELLSTEDRRKIYLVVFPDVVFQE